LISGYNGQGESESRQVAQPGLIQGSTGKLSTLTWS